jgi:regulatory protein
MEGVRLKRKRDEERTRNLTPEEIRRGTFQRALKLLAAKPHSIAELRDRLLRARTTNKAAVEAAISRLREYGYLDDERFAFGYASLKVQQRPVGRRRLKQELALKKVDAALAEEVLELVFDEVSEETLIDRAVEKRIRLRGRPRNRAEAKSLFDHLLRQGFPLEMVAEKVRSVSRIDLDETN